MEDSVLSLPVSGVQVSVLKKPQVLESDPTLMLVLCQLCSDKRLMQLKWHREDGKSFPNLFNTLKLKEMLVVSGRYNQEVYFHQQKLVCNRSIVVENVENHSPNGTIRDGCTIKPTADEVDKELKLLIHLFGVKMKLKESKSQLEKAGIRIPSQFLSTGNPSQFSSTASPSQSLSTGNPSQSSSRANPSQLLSTGNPSRFLSSGNPKIPRVETSSGESQTFFAQGSAGTVAERSRLFSIANKVKPIANKATPNHQVV